MENSKMFDILNSFNSRTEAYVYFGFSDNSAGILKLKNIAKSVGFDLNTYNRRRVECTNKCKFCNTSLNKRQLNFCSHSCSAKFNNQIRIVSEATKNKIKNTLSIKSQKNNKPKLCKICGQEKCVNIEICKHSKKWFNNLIEFGFDLDSVGTLKIFEEYYRIRELLLKEYFDNNLSPKDIAIKYNYNKNSENILHILKSFGIKTRNLSESEINACLIGKLNNNVLSSETKYQYKHGWHETWNGKKIYYRSSYELNFAINLDNNKIDYEVEYFRIKYWDSSNKKYRVAIPDFYIPHENKIIEIKSKFTLNKNNIIDKFNEYIKLGFSVLLILENKEYSYDDLINLKCEEINSRTL
jgi:hypothetical protein